MKKKDYITDFCVIGGGIAGFCAAISAARHGIKTILIHDRPVLGGNASSEIRMCICGSQGSMGRKYDIDTRETGIIEEIELENFYVNPQLNYSIWDSVLYSKAMYQENLTVLLNTSVFDAKMSGNSIESVTAWQSNSQIFHTVKAKYFADCSGDSVLASLSGAEYRYGREAKSEFNESIQGEKADNKTMGMSCIFQLRETDHYVKFTPPEWAYKYETDDDLPHKSHNFKTNFWWIEIGGDSGDCVHNTDECREELLKIAFGVWDHMKNKGDHSADNWELEWIGFLPGKRESIRYVGEYTVTQHDVESEGNFDDIVAYGGWTMDNHFPEGFYYNKGETTVHYPAHQPYGLPLRCMISKNIRNLTFAGRNISVTHAALSSTRVMATCGTLGQALGTAAAQAINDNVDIRNLDVEKLKQTLMFDDCLIPMHKRKVSPLTKMAACNVPVVCNGYDRGAENCWVGKKGDFIEFSFDKETYVNKLRIVFDTDLNRKYHNMPAHYPLVRDDYKLPDVIIKDFEVICTDSRGKETSGGNIHNHQRLLYTKIDMPVKKIKIVPKSTFGKNEFRIFSVDIL